MLFQKIIKKNKKITFLGVTFKPNTDDMREASSIPMINYLNKKNSKINYYDPSGEKVDFFLSTFAPNNLSILLITSSLFIKI